MKKQKPSGKLTPEEEEKIRLSLAQTPPSKKDIWAITIAFLLYLLPRALLIIGLFVLIIWLLFMS